MKNISWKVLVVFMLSVMAGVVLVLREHALSFAWQVAGHVPEWVLELGEFSSSNTTSPGLKDKAGSSTNETNMGRSVFPETANTKGLENDSFSKETSSKRVGTKSPSVVSREVLKREFTPSASSIDLNELLAILDQPSLLNIDSLSSSRLERYPDYQSHILPKLKERSLRNLIQFFEPEDWSNWELRVKGEGEKGLPAVKYLSWIYQANSDLGTFLDESALVFHRLFLSLQEGQLFDLEAELPILASLLHPDVVPLPEGGTPLEILRYVPSAPFIRLAYDPVFIKAYHRINSILVDDLVTRTDCASENMLAILSTLKPELASPAVVGCIKDLITEITLSEDSTKRLDLFLLDYNKGFLLPYALSNPRLRSLIGNLYVIGSLDAFKDDNIPLADVLYRQSLKISPGLPSQNRLAGLLYGDASRGQTGGGGQVMGTNSRENLGDQSKDMGELIKQTISEKTRLFDFNIVRGSSGLVIVVTLLLLGLAVIVSAKGRTSEPDSYQGRNGGENFL